MSLLKFFIRPIRRLAAISGYLQDVIWKNKYMFTESKVRICKTCFRRALTCAAEIRADTSKTKRIMRTTEMKVLRAITGHSLRDRIRNYAIQNECKILDIVKWTRSKRRNWRDRVMRMSPEAIVNMAMIAHLHAKRPAGRPPKRWYDYWTSF